MLDFDRHHTTVYLTSTNPINFQLPNHQPTINMSDLGRKGLGEQAQEKSKNYHPHLSNTMILTHLSYSRLAEVYPR